MKLKKIILIVVLILIWAAIIFLVVKPTKKVEKKEETKINVVASNFASYDFLRAVTNGVDKIDLKFLLGPGKDAHKFDPTAQDIADVQKANVFVYIGGTMEAWADKILKSDFDKSKFTAIKVTDSVKTIEEQDVDGAEPEEEEEEVEGAFDEHIWTSPENAKKMVKYLSEKMGEIDPQNAYKYIKNANEYIAKIDNLDNEIKAIVNAKVRDRLVFGDKMPMQYFLNYYGLKASAAFNGCSTEFEPSSKTIAGLVKIVKKNNTPVVLYIELNDGKVANTVAKEAGNGAKAMQIQTLHNVSLDDYKNGETYVSLMTRNLSVLKAALQ